MAEAETKPKEKAANLDRNDRDAGVSSPRRPRRSRASGSLAAPAERQAAAPRRRPRRQPSRAGSRPRLDGFGPRRRGPTVGSPPRAGFLSAAAPGQAAVLFRVALDASGRVASARPVGTGWVEPGLADFVRGMLFEPLPQAVGGARDAKDAAAPGLAASEIEIELKPR